MEQGASDGGGLAWGPGGGLLRLAQQVVKTAWFAIREDQRKWLETRVYMSTSSWQAGYGSHWLTGIHVLLGASIKQGKHSSLDRLAAGYAERYL